MSEPDKTSTPGEEAMSELDIGSTLGAKSMSEPDMGSTPGEESMSEPDKGSTPGEETMSEPDKGLAPGVESMSEPDNGSTPSEEAMSEPDIGSTPGEECEYNPHDIVIAHTAILVAQVLALALRSQAQLQAENLFLRKQLGLYQERGVAPRRPGAPSRWLLGLLSRWFDWRGALVVVRPETLIRWQRQGFRLLWRWKSRPGRPPIPPELRGWIRKMSRGNPLWGQERIASELRVKLGLRVSPRTVRKYMVPRPRGGRSRYDGQRWSTFLRNHAPHVIAADFFTVVTAKFDLIRVLVVMEHGSRRILHFNVTEHPTAQWTLQQFREALPWEHDYCYLVHDRDSIFSASLDESLKGFGIQIMKTPPRSPQTNAHCERLIGTIRRDCLDHVIPLGEIHTRRILGEWAKHYNRGRPHSSLGPGIPEPRERPIPVQSHRHRLPAGAKIEAATVLGGLHHEYRLRPTPS